MSAPITYAAARAALQRLIDHAFGNKAEAPRFRIPAEPTDDDLLLDTVLREWRDSKARAEAAEAKVAKAREVLRGIAKTADISLETKNLSALVRLGFADIFVEATDAAKALALDSAKEPSKAETDARACEHAFKRPNLMRCVHCGKDVFYVDGIVK